MPNPFIVFLGCDSRKNLNGQGEGKGVTDEKIFSEPTAAALFVPIVFVRLAS